MKTKLMIAVFFALTSWVNAQSTDENQALNKIISDFSSSIKDGDEDTFNDLFLHDSITWAAILEGKTKQMILQQRPDFTFVSSDYKTFFKNLVDSSEEQFYNVDIDVRNHFATIGFDYSFSKETKITNWGTEYWSLMKVNGNWKITSVTWTMNMENIDPFQPESKKAFKMD